MKNWHNISSIFRKQESRTASGLFVTLEELIEQRRYTAYLRELNTRKSLSSQSGEVKSAFKGRGMELEEIRNYSFGDDIRDIDWRVTARKLTPYTKLYAEERDREIYVALDLSPAMAFGTRNELKSVAAAKIAALLGWMSLENKDRFGSVIFDGKQITGFKPQNHKNALLAILKKVASVTKQILQPVATDTSDSMVRALQRLQQSIKSQAVVFVVSDFNSFDEAMSKTIAALSRKAKVYCVNIFDILEEVAPAAGEYMAENQGQTLIFDSSEPRFQEAYRAYFAEKRYKIKDFCRKFSCPYMEVRTDLDLYKQIKIK